MTAPSENSAHEKDAASLAFDITRQFITIAVGGIGFAVGVQYAAPSAISSLTFWAILIVFGGSAIFGLLFLMHGVWLLSIKKSYNVYATGLRMTSIMQILLVALGVMMLCSFLGSPVDQPNGSIKINIGDDSLIYPHETNKNYTIEIENGKVIFSATE